MTRTIVVFLCIVLLTGFVRAQPDRAAAVDLARNKFEREIARIDEALLANFEKAMEKAAKMGNRAVVEKLKYERPLFVSDHLVPTTVAATEYLRDRSKATTALLAVCQPAITDLNKAKKYAEVEAIEDNLNSVLKASRGYGLAFPNDLETHPSALYRIENKGSGLVVDPEENRKGGRLVLTQKNPNRLAQCWRIERIETNFALINAASGLAFDLNGGNPNPGFGIGLWPVDRKAADFDVHLVFRLTSIRRFAVIEPISSRYTLTATERTLKGVLTTYLTQEKRESPPADTQLWRFVEVK